MEYKNISNQGSSSGLTKIIAIIGLVLSTCTSIILFIGLNKLNDEINLFRSEQEQLIYKLYDSNQDDNIVLKSFFGGGYRTMDGLEAKRLKRDILGTAIDGIPINSDTYTEEETINKTRNEKLYLRPHPISNSPVPAAYSQQPDKDSTTSTQKPIIYSRRSKVMHNDDKKKYRSSMYKRPTVKSFNSNPDEDLPHRQKRVGSDSRLTPMIHIYGEVSETIYLGNSRLVHNNSHFINWTKPSWVNDFGMNKYFKFYDGHLIFLETGLYFIYAQIYYVDEHDTNGFGVYRDVELVLQCTTSTFTNRAALKANTCYTAGVILFSKYDRLEIRDLEANRFSVFQKEKSFFGAVQLDKM